MTSHEAMYHPLTPLVPVARALADTALECQRRSEVTAMVGAAVQRKRCSLRDLLAELEYAPRNRSALLRWAIAQALDGARSAAEAAAIRKLARHRRVPEFEPNVPIVDGSGRTLYVVDVLWRSLRAVLEIDSREFHIDDAEWTATMARHNALTRFRLAVTHQAPSVITGRDEAWLDELACWLADRAAELGVPVPAPGGALRPAGDEPRPLVVRVGPSS